MSGRFALYSSVLPGHSSYGQAMITYRILSGIDPERYCLIGPPTMDRVRDGVPPSPGLDAKTHLLPRDYPAGLDRLRPLLKGWVMLGRALRIARILRSERCEAITACTGNSPYDPPAAYLASRLARVPFHFYMLDWYAEMATVPRTRRRLELAESRLVRRAASVMVPSESLSESLQERYGVRANVVHNCCDVDAYGPWVDRAPTTLSSERRIVYTGVVSDSWVVDALRSTLSALERIRGARLHLYTSLSAEATRDLLGSTDSLVHHEQLPVGEMPRVQTSADVLLLPLGSRAAPLEILRTAGTSKLGEYLAAHRPILAVVPADAFAASYLRTHRCGLVADPESPDAIAAAVRRLLEDEPLVADLVARGAERARADFSLDAARQAFEDALAGRRVE